MSDLISRQAAIDVLRNRWLKTRNYEGIGEDIAEECEIYLKTLPSAQQWIPCTPDTMPKDDTEVIVSCTDDSGDYEFSYATTGWHYKGLWVVNNDRCYFVKAWQPLPEAWKGEEHGTPRAVLSQKPVR